MTQQKTIFKHNLIHINQHYIKDEKWLTISTH